jgi:hypothetical protein
MPASLSQETSARSAANDSFEWHGRAHNVDPLWMISVAAALLFIFLAFASAFG